MQMLTDKYIMPCVVYVNRDFDQDKVILIRTADQSMHLHASVSQYRAITMLPELLLA